MNNDQHWLETYKSLITLSTEAFKFAALANGGAAVALLAYMGNIAGKGVAAPDMRFPMAAFLAGLFLCGTAMLFGYLTQLKLLDESRGKEKPTVKHHWLLRTAIALFACSLIAFGYGSWLAVVGFADPSM
jgi:hypothetical protein